MHPILELHKIWRQPIHIALAPDDPLSGSQKLLEAGYRHRRKGDVLISFSEEQLQRDLLVEVGRRGTCAQYSQVCVRCPNTFRQGTSCLGLGMLLTFLAILHRISMLSLFTIDQLDRSLQSLLRLCFGDGTAWAQQVMKAWALALFWASRRRGSTQNSVCMRR